MSGQIKVRKSTLLFTLLGVVVLVVLAGLFSFYQRMDAVWNDQTSWNLNGFVFPDQNNDLKVKKTTNDGVTSVEVPFCMLFRIDRGDNVTYNCSLTPQVYFQRYKLVNNNTALIGDALKERYIIESDAMWTYKPSKDPQPKAFLKNQILSENSFTTMPENAVPVKVAIRYKEKEREKNIFSVIQHYIAFKLQNKKEDRVLDSEILEWSVEQIPSADEYFASKTPVEYIKEWRKSFLDEMTTFMEPSRTKDLEGEALLGFMGLKLAFDYKECFKDETAGYICRVVNANNPGSYLPYLLSTIKNGDPEYHLRLQKAIYQVVEPFYNGKYEFKALKPPEKQNEPSLQSYNYPICPINEIKKGELNSFEVKMFTDYMKAYDATNTGVTIDRTTLSLSEYAKRVSSLDLNKPIIFTPDIVADLNENCSRYLKSGKKLNSIVFHTSLSPDDQNLFLILLTLKYGPLFETGLANINTTGTIYDYHKIYSADDKDLATVAKHMYNELTFQPYKTGMILQVNGIYDKSNEYNDRPDIWAWRRSYTATQTMSLIFYYGTDAIK